MRGQLHCLSAGIPSLVPVPTMLVFEVGPSASASGPMLKVPEEKAAALGEGRPPQLTHGHQGQTMGRPQ